MQLLPPETPQAFHFGIAVGFAEVVEQLIPLPLCNELIYLFIDVAHRYPSFCRSAKFVDSQERLCGTQSLPREPGKSLFLYIQYKELSRFCQYVHLRPFCTNIFV